MKKIFVIPVFMVLGIIGLFGVLSACALFYPLEIYNTVQRLRDATNNVKTISPDISITSPVTDIHINTLTYFVEGIASDNVKLEGVYLIRNNSIARKVNGTTNWNTNITDFDEGTNIIEVYAVDTDGNTSTTQSVKIIVDTNAPTVPVVSGSADNADTTPMWSWNTIFDAVKYRYSFTDGSGWAETPDINFTSPTNLAVNTTNTLYVQAGDAANNWSASGSNTIVVLPRFTEINPGTLTNVENSSIDLGDIDGDGDLDLILTGNSGSSYVSKIYTNNGSGSFGEINSGSLTGVNWSSIKLGDIDGDGTNDLILTGNNGGEVSMIYQNDGSGGFTEINSTDLINVSYSSIDLGDIDGDGDLDLILTGDSINGDGGEVSKIYQNDGSGGFSEINPTDLADVQYSSIVLGDIDGDETNDLILTGSCNNMPGSEVSKIYQNDGSGGFNEINLGSLTPVCSGSIKLGDINGDGANDLILTGHRGGKVSKIYQNDGSGSFVEINLGSLTDVDKSSIDLGDIDNDGDLDLILTGRDGSSPVSKIYQNDGTGSFIEDTSSSLTGVQYSSIKLGDIDGDGDLDLILTGEDSSGDEVSKIYRNNTIN